MSDIEEEDVLYARCPSMYRNDQLLNFAKAEDKKLYQKGTSALGSTFGCDPDDFTLFLNELSDRANSYGWKSILTIPVDKNVVDGPTNHLIDEYGRVSIERVRADASSYIGTICRQDQDAYMLFECLQASLSPEAKKKCGLFKKEFTVNGIPSGPLLLKVIIRESHVDTKATVRLIRESMSAMDTLMEECHSNIATFNNHVRRQIASLAARGESSSDIIPNLFKGYAKAGDQGFRDFIMRKRDDYDQDIQPPLDAESLMALAESKFRARVESKEWEVQSTAEKLVALEATFANYVSKTKPKGTGGKKKERGTPPGPNSKPGTERKLFEKPKWMLVAPKQGEARSKTMDDKEYHWCAKHASWVRHKPSECLLSANGEKKNAAGNNNKKKETKDTKKVKLDRAYANAAAAVEDPDESDE